MTEIEPRAVDSAAAQIERFFNGTVDANRVDDPAGRYIAELLGCPALAKQMVIAPSGDSARLLASRCNFR